jgi:hypothetical protein
LDDAAEEEDEASTSVRDAVAHAGLGSRERIYWLDGMAGTGKSTIARTVARRFHNEGFLGASFFFSRGGGELETARKFVTTVAVQLARRSPQLRRHICHAVRAEDDDDVAHLTLDDQWSGWRSSRSRSLTQPRRLARSWCSSSMRIGLADEEQAWHRQIIQHQVDRSVVDRDIMVYFKHVLADIRRKASLPPR